jgi:hypothetical protein
MTAITLPDLTNADPAGSGVFDVLMRSLKGHLDLEAKKNAIKGPEYATVYLGQIQPALSAALQFLASREKIGLEADLLRAQTELINKQILNEIQQNKVLIAQECLLKAQFDNTVQNTLKSASETDLLKQKIVTEKAQTLELGVDDNSVVGQQKSLYQAQKEGFKSDAKQKTAQILIGTWNTRRMSDDGVVADSVNKLDDVHIGRVVEALMTDINA